jgi:hypothetical protein
MYTAVIKVIGTYLTTEANYVATLKTLMTFLAKHPDFYLLVKPWHGDDVRLIRKIYDVYGNSKVLIIDPAINLHNVELLAITDMIVGTFSSLIGEAVAMKVPFVLLDYPESHYYFEDEHLTECSSLAIAVVSTPDQLYSTLESVTEGDERQMTEYLDRAEKTLRSVFGEPDGKGATRVARFALEHLNSSAASPRTVRKVRR